MGDLVIATGDSHPDNEMFRESGNLGNQWNQIFINGNSIINNNIYI